MLSKKQILSLLEQLNTELVKEKAIGELYLMGGAVMCLAYDARASTQDLDAVFKPAKIIRDAARRIADRNNYPQTWLNDGVKGFLSDAASFEPFLELSNLRVLKASAEYMLAMKCLAMRIGKEFHDQADVTFLLRYLNITSFAEAVKILDRYYPKEQYPQKTFDALEELIETLKS